MFSEMASFNPRSRVGSDHYARVEGSRRLQFQSTLPRGERRPPHPLPKGRTGFNPRSRVGSDELQNIAIAELAGFNPRSRVGSDPDSRKTKPEVTSFNPRSRVGSDANAMQSL